MDEPMIEVPGLLALRELSLASKLEEDKVWYESFGSALKWLPDNVQRICYYGFTEILNNAIDHSQGTKIRAWARLDDGKVRLFISDDGIGIFEKLRSHFNYPDYHSAILDLIKGKLTTDSENHTGQGIFFTSRAFDHFILHSNKIGFHHSSDEDDWFIESALEDLPGTMVIMTIAPDCRRNLREVFDMFTDLSDGDYPFSKTHVPLKLAKYGSQDLVSRSEAKRILSRFEGFKVVDLDFAGVDSIGQGFADEIFRVFRLAHPEIRVVAVNANEPVEQMINRALAHRAEPDTGPLVIPTVKELLEKIRAGKESRAIIPVPASKSLAFGDRVVFAEATFGQFGTPSLIPHGDSLSIVLTKAVETGDFYQTMRLFEIAWDPVSQG